MHISERKIKDVFEINLNPLFDERGFFMRTYDFKILAKHRLNREWVQENHSRSEKRGTIRGLHFQFPPFVEAKLVRVIRGSIKDVFVDLRKNSPTFGQWDAIILSEDLFNCIYIPRGFAHGFCTISDYSEVIYKVDNYYSPENEGGIIWDDKDLNINWPTKNPILSDKDKKNITLNEFIEKYDSIDIT